MKITRLNLFCQIDYDRLPYKHETTIHMGRRYKKYKRDSSVTFSLPAKPKGRSFTCFQFDHDTANRLAQRYRQLYHYPHWQTKTEVKII